MGPAQRYESEPRSAAPLGQPLHFQFSGRTAPNRFLKAAMTERMSSWDVKDLNVRGVPSSNLINVYKRWGEGSFGLILTGNIMIEPDQLEASGNPIIPRTAELRGERFDAFSKLATAAKAHGSLIVGQVSHPGRQVPSHLQSAPISASDIQLQGDLFGMTFNQPRPASEQEINRIIDGFAHAAEFMEKAGFDGIELHGAHGYLLAQFLSPTTNKRTDKYGGPLENRVRIIVEIARAVRQRTTQSFILGIKLNSVEFQDQGFTPEDARKVCEMLEQNEFDFVELSGGTYQSLAFGHKRESTRKREAFFLDFADEIAPVLTKTRSYVTGGFKTVGAMVQGLDVVDGVGLGRPAAQEPYLPRDILAGKVTGAAKMLLDDADFGITNVAAGAQIRQLGKDQDPVDLSRDENVQGFMKDVEKWQKALRGDTTGGMYGFPDLESVEAVPYGTAAASA